MTKTPNSITELIQVAKDDPKYIIESGFWIPNKEQNVVPFVFNRNQNILYEQRTNFDDILKGSQFGVSSEILAIFTVKFLLVQNSWCVSISHEDEATQRLFSKVKFYLDHLPPWLKPFVRLKQDAAHTLVNSVMNTRFFIGTAGRATAFGRGDTVHYVHASELSRWKDNGVIMTNLLRAMPKTNPQVWAVKETTANGEGNYHHREWQRETREWNPEKGLQAGFKPVFLSWLDHDEYGIKDGKITDGYTTKEILLKKRFPNKVTDEKLVWRRSMISTLGSEPGHEPEELFEQEFPATPDEAFLKSGNPIFPAQHLANYKSRAIAPIAVGNIVGLPPNEIFDETPNGYVKLWDFPAIEDQFIIFADVGQFSDYCSAHVVNKKDWRMVAHFHGRIRANAFGGELQRLGYFFNKAMIGVEINNMGQSTIDRLIELNYPNLYTRKRLEKKTKKVVDEFGWLTSNKTKPLIIGYGQEIIRLEQAEIPDLDTLNELGTYIKNEDGSMGASPGNFDDRVISFCGVYYILKLHPFVESRTAGGNKTLVNKVRKFAHMRRAKKVNRLRR